MRQVTKVLAVVVCLLGADEALAQYCPTNPHPSPPDRKPKKREDDQVCRAKDMVGDPVAVFGNEAFTFDRIEDFAISTPLGEVGFVRTFVSDDKPWSGFSSSAGAPEPNSSWRLAGVPKPFGASRTEPRSLRWSHNFFAFVDARRRFPTTPTAWVVRPPVGSQEEFGEADAGTWARQQTDSPGQPNRLFRNTNGTFEYFQKDGKRYAFEEQAATDAGSLYFLSRVLAPSGETIASVVYALPDAGCPSIAGGPAPYVSQIQLAAGPLLTLRYSAKGTPTECVLSSITTSGVDGGLQVLAAYTYDSNLPGHIARVETQAFTEDYSAFGSGFTVSRGGATIVSHDSSVVGAAQDRTGVLSIGSLTGSVGVADWCGGNSACCSKESGSISRFVTYVSSLTGDGAGTSAGLVEEYAFGRGDSAATRHEHETLGRRDSCSATDACSPGTVRYLTRGSVNESGSCGLSNPGHIFAVKDKRDNWVVTPSRFVTDGGDHALEKVAEFRGVPSSYDGVGNAWPDAGADGGNALETTRYSYVYINGAQHLLSETRPSAIAGSVETTYARDGGDGSGRLRATFVSGSTMLLDGGVAARVVGTFYSHDSLGRVVEVNGPCFVANTSAWACPDSTSPRVVNQYYAAGNGTSSGQLQSVTRYTSSSSFLTTTYSNYTADGEPRTVVDENGITTLFEYVDHQVASRQVLSGANPKWEYTWENEKLVAIKFPEGNYEAFCFRALSSPDSSCSGTWTGRLTRRSKAASADGVSGWSEATTYTYRADGTLATETRYTNSGGPVPRYTKTFAADAHKRPTYEATGASGSAFVEKRGYDAADNLRAIGRPFNGPPSYCLSGGVLSKACSQLFYDRANRLRQLDVYPDASLSAANRVCIDYDQRGNVNRVTSGCSESDTCSTESTGSSCSGQPASDYVTDDFGNVVEVRPAGSYNESTSSVGVYRFEFDALGNVVRQQTEAQRQGTPTGITFWLEHDYDRMGRKTQTREMWKSVTATPFIVSQFDYDDSGASPPSGCPQPANSKGRLRRSRDPLLTRWYQYDGEGRVVREIRLPDGATNCAGALDLALSYSANGNLTNMTYGHGRQVSYLFGDGGLKDREASVVVKRFTDGGLVDQTVADQVTWEPYGGLRSYRIHFEDGGTASVAYEMGAAATTPSSDCPSGALTETVDQTNRLRSLSVTRPGASDLYRKVYQWSADEITRISTCYKGNAANTITEVFSGSGYGYDGAGRLKGGWIPDYDYTGGPYKAATYNYDRRDNATRFTVTPIGHYYTLTYSPVAKKNDRLSSVEWVTSYNRTDFDYDGDGKTTRVYGRADSSSNPGADLRLYYTDSDNIGPGGLTAAREVAKLVAGGYSNTVYWYDNQLRRQAKLHPVNDLADLFLYDLGHQLLEDRGLENLTNSSPTWYPIDEYIWLDGRPIAIYRSKVSAATLQHAPDGVGVCTRMNEAADCGLHYVVSDHIPKPVLALNARGQVTGVGEYEPNGNINRVQHWFMYGFPYTTGASGPIWSSFRQRDFGMEVAFRNHFTMLDTEADCSGNLREGPSLWKAPWDTMLWALWGHHQGDTWSSWVPASPVLVGWRGLTLGWGTVSGNCSPGCTGSCPSSGGWPYMGFVHREYEYRRYDTGAKPYFPPLRFPGHYWDEDTDLFENWHRQYYSLISRYLSPEPMLQDPTYVRRIAETGIGVPTYAYAFNNPLSYVDDDGLAGKKQSCKDRCRQHKVDRMMLCDLAGRGWKECADEGASEFAGCMDTCEDKPPKGPYRYRLPEKDKRKLPACDR